MDGGWCGDAGGREQRHVLDRRQRAHRGAFLRIIAALILLPLLWAGSARAEVRCLLVLDTPTGQVLHESGAGCDSGIGPASTFKLTLAVIGYDAGILTGPETPSWAYKPAYNAGRAVDRMTTTPRKWMHDSVLWYSRVLVADLGATRFARYIRDFGYGNMDVSGEPGADNGLTHSWLNTSLLVSPRQQAGFLQNLILGRLPVSTGAADAALAILPRFDGAGGWTLTGKTGTGYQREADGQLGRRQYGWFIGYAQKDGLTRTFAYLVADEKAGQAAAGPRARDDLLARWDSLGLR